MTNQPDTSIFESHASKVLDNDHPGVKAAANSDPDGWLLTLRHLQDTVVELIPQDIGILQNDFKGRLVYRGECEQFPALQTSLARWVDKHRESHPQSELGPPHWHSEQYLRELRDLQVNMLQEARRMGLLELPSSYLDSSLPISSLLADRPDVLKMFCGIQHRGGPTNLLDWTYNMYVALYFACRTVDAKAGCVWFLLPSKIERDDCRFLASDPDDLRTQVQSSLLLCIERGQMVWQKEDQDRVRGVTIPSEHKDRLRQYLFESQGLQYHTLFPDLQGLVDWWGKKIKNMFLG